MIFKKKDRLGEDYNVSERTFVNWYLIWLKGEICSYFFIRSLYTNSPFENELQFGLNFMTSPSVNGSGIKLSVQVARGNCEIRPVIYLYILYTYRIAIRNLQHSSSRTAIKDF